MLMGKATRLGVLGSLVVAGTLALSGGPAMVAGSSMRPTAYTCTGGAIPSGNYASVTVTGACSVAPDAVISVFGDVYVAPNAQFDAQSAPSTITVARNVTAAPGSLLELGCQPDTDHAQHPCTVEPDGHSTITVNGYVTAIKANTVLLNGITVNRDVTLIGGGGPIPWAIKNNTVGGNLTIWGVTADWVGLLFNRIGGNATLLNITINDPGDPTPTIQIVENTVGRNLNCFGLGPNVAGGFIPGEVNTVGGKATGQCANLQSGG
jgi:hypothetical protein